jgi:hypothetical protein
MREPVVQLAPYASNAYAHASSCGTIR